MGSHPQADDDGDVLLTAPRTTVKRPAMFRVMMLNDDYTPMEFVVETLKRIFHMQHEDALSTMLQVHHQGAASCGVYTRDVAETKCDLVADLAREHEYPLQCKIEKEPS